MRDRLEISRPSGSDGKPLPCLMIFWGSAPLFGGRITGPDVSKVNERASTYSIFNDTLETYYNTKLYSLNRFNFEAGYRVSSYPRAVGYSAGLDQLLLPGAKLISSLTRRIRVHTLSTNNGTGRAKGSFYVVLTMT